MRIGLIDVDGHAKKKKWGATIYPNLALCKISAYHKARGDTVEWYDNIFGGTYNIVYVAKVFSFSPDIDFVINAEKVVYGGTGYSIESALPKYIDDCYPDYSIYPLLDKSVSYGFLTRGCPNKCPWCVVPKKEGKIRPYWDIERVANGNKKIVLMDNNFLAAGDYAHEQLDKIIRGGYFVDFNQALDARLVTEEFARKLAKMKWLSHRIRFGCDTTAQIKQCKTAIDLINSYGFKGEYFLYTMIGGNNGFKECLDRINYWRNILLESRTNKSKSIRPCYAYAQPYRDPYKHHVDIPAWQADMARWCNKKMLYTTCDFKDYEPRKGFRCEQYIKDLYF